jgi:hypothetical protein
MQQRKKRASSADPANPRVKTLGQRVVNYHLSKELADQATMYGDQCLADVDLGTDKLRSGIDRHGA